MTRRARIVQATIGVAMVVGAFALAIFDALRS